MRVLQIASLYPPKMLGGAEVSARNLSDLLATAGHEVLVVRASDGEEPEGEECIAPRIRVARLRTPHIYPVFRFYDATPMKKPLWHLQDHFDQRLRPAFGRILDDFAPDLVNVHLLQGLGYPLLREVAKRRIPVNYVLPDLGLACFRMNMFKNGKDCAGHCAPCALSTRYKLGLIRQQSAVSFVSPSRANLESLSRHFPVKDYPHTVILNPNTYPRPTRGRTQSDDLRLLYAGRIHDSKGAEMLLGAVEALARDRRVTLTLAGQGQQEAELRARFGDAPWCNFLGFISHQELADRMMESDLLCIPSIWAENSPGVVIQALGLGLPVMGSARGGIPELVRDHENGRLVHDTTLSGWQDALSAVLEAPEALKGWRSTALAEAYRFDARTIGRQMLDWMEASAGRSAPRQ
ncbi:MAG: glycosyltransferase [Sphingomonadales bacterium]|nr:glycosyltransferase [Sphingomonadales bacterium]